MMTSTSTFTPTTRSRTLLFISYRDSSARTPRASRSSRQYEDSDHPFDENEGLINHQGGTAHISLDVELPPKWVDYVEQVEDILAATQAKVAALDKLHAKHVLPGFADRSLEEREIEVATSDITKDFRQCQALIQRIGVVAAAPDHSFPPGRSDVAQHNVLAAKNTQRGLAAKVQELSAAFRKKQRVYMEKLQGHAIKNQDLLVASGVTSLKGSDALTAVDEDIEAASHSQLVDQQLLEPNLRARDRELTEIAKSIATLAELFKDLSSLVIDQGTLLDSVEYNIEQTAVHMSGAVKELEIATRYQKNTGRRKCIFLLLLIIFGLIVVLIFKPRRHSSAATPITPITTQSPQGPSTAQP
ncbi:t-SNARE [Lactarius indigo]|nr:t-SNARE [Lactarius indigo]